MNELGICDEFYRALKSGRVAYGFQRGNLVYALGKKNKKAIEFKNWKYADGNKFDESKPCIRCGEFPTEEGYDACLGYLKNVKSACCGHGVENGYVITNNGKNIEIGEYTRKGHEHDEGK